MTALSRPVHVEGLQSLAERYDLVLCDVWGVLHNGVEAYEAASDALTRFRAKGGQVVLVSNAPRPGASVGTQLDGFGVPRSAYDAIVTSGDLTRLAIEERIRQVVHHIGPPRDMPIYDGLDVRFGSIDEADYVVCSGFDDDENETVENYRAAARGHAPAQSPDGLRQSRPHRRARPHDPALRRHHRVSPTRRWAARFYYAGKPHRPVYEQGACGRRPTSQAIDPEGQGARRRRCDPYRYRRRRGLRHRFPADRPRHPCRRSWACTRAISSRTTCRIGSTVSRSGRRLLRKCCPGRAWLSPLVSSTGSCR